MAITEGWLKEQIDLCQQRRTKALDEAVGFQGAAQAFEYCLAEVRRQVDAADKPPPEERSAEDGARPDQA